MANILSYSMNSRILKTKGYVNTVLTLWFESGNVDMTKLNSIFDQFRNAYIKHIIYSSADF